MLKSFLILFTCLLVLPSIALADWRNITNGYEIPTKNYADQPYIVKTDDGAWLCLLTTGAGHEGHSGQHVISLRSTDYGQTWSEPVTMEPADGPEASYAVPLKVPGGRIYAFYNHNTDNIRKVIADNPPYTDGYCYRVDSLGYFVFKYSDDGGRTWSEKRYPVSVREFEIDRQNPYEGRIRFFWNVGKAFHHNGNGFVPLHKVGGFGHGFFTRNEGVLLKSPNILTETNPEKIIWQTLPDGDIGLRTPPGGGPIAAEQSFSVLSDGSFYCVYRSVDGHPVFTYSRDGGHTWDTPKYKRYADGRLIKHPRAANFAWRCNNGNYLYWFHNHGGRTYSDRNPAWISGGVEIDTPGGKKIKWSQPEILLYDDHPSTRMSYPDLIEDDGRYFITETQKTIARVHEIDRYLINALWGQFDNKTVVTKGLVLDWPSGESKSISTIEMPDLPNLMEATNGSSNGFSIGFWFELNSLKPGQRILDSRGEAGKGIFVTTGLNGSIIINLNDGRTANHWQSDEGMIQPDQLHHVGITVDGGPKIITFVVDGKVNDGGDKRQFGWGRFSPYLSDVNAGMLQIGPEIDGELKQLRIYNRYLLNSELIANHQAGLESQG